MRSGSRRNCRPKVDWEKVEQERNFEKNNTIIMSWDLSNGIRLQTLNLHTNDINSVCFGRNFTLATGSSDKTAGLWKWVKGSGFATCSNRLTDHKYSITCVEFSPYGTILATSSVDGCCLLWDVTSGEKMTSFIQPGNAAIRVCHFSSTSTLLLTAGDSGSVYIWDISTRKLQNTFDHGEEAIYGASFCPAESYLISGCGGGLLQLWDASGSHNKSLAIAENAHEGGVASVTFGPALVSSDGGLAKQCLMVTGGHDSFVKLWNVTLGLDYSIEPLRTFEGHSGSVFCVRVSFGIIASASGDKTVRLWNLSGKCIKVLEGHDRYVTSCCFSSDGRILASGKGYEYRFGGLNFGTTFKILFKYLAGSNDKTVIVWDLTGTLQLSDELKVSTEYSLTAEEMWPQYEKLCKSRMQQESNISLKASFKVPKVDFNSCLIIGSTYVVAASSSSKCVFTWMLDTLAPVDISSICSHKYSVNSVSYCPQLELLASASSDGTINLCDIQKKEKVGGLYHPSGGALRVCQFSPDGSLLLAAGDDEKASLWKVKSQSLVKQFCEHEAAIYGASFTPCGQYAVTGCSNGHLKLWDCQSHDSTASIYTQQAAHELGVTTCEFSPKGLGGSKGQHCFLLASGGNDSLIKLWQVSIGSQNLANFILWQTFTDHGTANIMCVTFSKSGKLLASAAGDKTVRLWNINAGTCIQVIEAHERYVTCVAFSTGSMLISCSSDHTVKVWQLHGYLACETAAVENLAIEKMVSEWTCEEVVKWLAEIGLGDLGHVFESTEVDGARLIRMTDSILLEELKIDEENVRKQVLVELQWLKSLGLSSKKTISQSVTITAPSEFFCPITHEIFTEPVTCSDGHNYDRNAIQEWFLTGKTTSPLTNMELDNVSLTPNFELQNRISEFLAQRLNSSA